ncbi:MAG: hypothetical protein RLZZ337_704 [Bacteroidota bacterium]|jgi:outer membrane protein OmpA-like peptidoglycan-associated protein
MNRHLLTFLVALFLLSPFANAQSYNKKYGFEINGGLREYHGDLGSALYLQQAPNYQAAGIAFGMYINPSFDANIYGAVGDLGFYKPTYDEVAAASYRQGFRAHITELNLGVTFKFANGNIISEDARFKPFLRAGLGGIQAISLLSHNKVGYSRSRTWYSSNVNGGVGVKIGLTDALDLVISEQYNYSFDDNYDGAPFTLAGAILNDAEEGNKPLHDIYAYHNIGIVFNFGSTGNSGYKIKDSDGDGVSDKFDLCPKTPAGYQVDDDGCPLDDDKDGVINEEDKCPKLAGLPEFGGCPELKADLIDLFNAAAKGIYFETAQDVIKTESFVILDSLVTILNANPNLRVQIEGHTDNQGDADANIDLSQKRANALKRYLVEKGIGTARLTPVGYGETKPIADNETPEGRALNRRVNFVLSYY